ncbi:uncharacterized protein LOC121810288 isoform X3 [Salvia splendens]|uniref:uncharacterized protein LOC121810288 isoform X3 n=1 Tax=Salvia splendens TaxID=180675 RepID=UPI001C27F4C2|nr:uncharacterized protein LOC121810288 isoform X3 [Salvia splendens]
MNNEDGIDIAIPIPIPIPIPTTQFNEYQTSQSTSSLPEAPTMTEAKDDQPPETQLAPTPSSTHFLKLKEISSTNIEAGKHTANIAAAEEEDAEEENPDHQSMYRAATKGNWEEAKILLNKDEKLGWIEITEQSDRAIHLAVSGKHREFVRQLIEMVGWEMLELYDGNGYTPCCYAIMAGDLELVRILMEANPFIANLSNFYGTTPFALAISFGKTEIVEYYLTTVTEIKGLSREQWFNILLVAISSKMLDVALRILEMRSSLALMKGVDNRTALHVLCQMDISSGDGKKRKALRCLSEKLWTNIQDLGRNGVLQLMKSPPLILHEAAKVGNLDLIKMITTDYPDLLAHTDDKHGYSIFHIIVIHRKENILQLLEKARFVKDFNAVLQDKDGNNLLHSAAKSTSKRLKGLEVVGEHDVHMQNAIAWFEKLKNTVPPYYQEMRNKKGYTPEELFWKEHTEMLATSEAYTKKTAESCMLISTLVLTLVFAAAFAPPGGFDQVTGIPMLLKNKWFPIFIIFQVLALSSSTLSILGFWSIISSNFPEREFFMLPRLLRISMCALLLSILFVISAFLSAFFLIFVQHRKALVLAFMLPLYLLLVLGISYQFIKVTLKTSRLEYYRLTRASSGKYESLSSRVHTFGASKFSVFSSYFR